MQDKLPGPEFRKILLHDVWDALIEQFELHAPGVPYDRLILEIVCQHYGLSYQELDSVWARCSK